MNTPKIKESTEASYLKIAKASVNHSRAKRVSDWEESSDLSMTEIAQDLIAREDIAPNTKQSMRSALMWFFRTQQDSRSPDGIQAIDLLESMKIGAGRPTKPRPKSISIEDIHLIEEELLKRSIRSEWATRTRAWIWAGLITGARPIEWLNAEWDSPEKTHLKILNAKVHLGPPAFLRGKAGTAGTDEDQDSEDVDLMFESSQDKKYRLIPIETDRDRFIIDQHLDRLHAVVHDYLTEDAKKDLFTKYFGECRQTLSRVVKKLWGAKKKYSFYTFRKQFSANMKAQHGSGITTSLMGHSGPNSPSTGHYVSHPGRS